MPAQPRQEIQLQRPGDLSFRVREKSLKDHPERRTLFFWPYCRESVTVNVRKREFVRASPEQETVTQAVATTISPAAGAAAAGYAPEAAICA
jgi:hypothetical protein